MGVRTIVREWTYFKLYVFAFEDIVNSSWVCNTSFETAFETVRGFCDPIFKTQNNYILYVVSFNFHSSNGRSKLSSQDYVSNDVQISLQI